MNAPRTFMAASGDDFVSIESPKNKKQKCQFWRDGKSIGSEINLEADEGMTDAYLSRHRLKAEWTRVLLKTDDLVVRLHRTKSRY